ncbi:polar amino acid transport system substrate-binding protein [Agrococcus baldri]|uniref:Polar amino acid transport system substrate-binding protein n=1 Tax=Agrococcus baldri TaxID=153730 RepID=A0AA94KZP0_9MICO|nr:transporter substrate-binding domain-containing protein [Agrococcus baldri]SFS11806.1 polar amino acid transport system substrate-binding protein [Agrococcus baldri]
MTNTFRPANGRRRRARVAALTLSLPLAGVLLAGCASTGVAGEPGSNAGAGASGIRPDVQALLTEELRGALEDQLPEGYANGEPMQVATDATIGIPIATFDENNEHIEGLAVDMAQAVSWVLGRDASISHAVWDTLIPGLEAGRFDYVTTVMLDTEVRQEQVDFVDYLADGSSILVQTESDFNDLTVGTMCGLSVGVMRGSYEEFLLTEQNPACDEPIDIQVYAGINEGMLAVQSERVDAMMGAASQLTYVETMSNGALRSAGDVVEPGIDGIAIAKDSPLVPAIQAAVQELMDTGVYMEILALYGMEQNAIDAATINLG